MTHTITKPRLRTLAALAAVVSAFFAVTPLTVATPTWAQQQPASPAPAAVLTDDDEEPMFIEAVPADKLEKVRDARRELERRKLYGADATRGIYSSALAWPPQIAQISVCFMGGDDDLRAHVVTVASDWKSIPGARVPLDFADASGKPRTCTGQPDERIRVGFEPKGMMSSAVGTQSRSGLYPLAQPSMILGFQKHQIRFEKVRRSILHEFGHALGLEHEHEHPQGKCTAEYDKDKLHRYLNANYGWSPSEIAQQLNLFEKQGILLPKTTPFDKSSIMIYSFPPVYYLRGNKSHCHSTAPPALSDGDKGLAAQLFPARSEDQAVVAQKRRAFLQAQSSPPERTRGLIERADGGEVGAQVDLMILELMESLGATK